MREISDTYWFSSDVNFELSEEDFAELESEKRQKLLSELEKLSFVKIETYLPDLPADTLGMLIPKTRIVFKGPPFLHALFKTILSALVINSNDAWPVYALAISALGEAINDLKSSIQKLNKNIGEACSYSAIYGESWKISQGLKTKIVKKKKAWKVHKDIRNSCQIKECKFHQKGCRLKRDTFDDIIDNLVEKELLVISEDEKGVKVIL